MLHAIKYVFIVYSLEKFGSHEQIRFAFASFCFVFCSKSTQNEQTINAGLFVTNVIFFSVECKPKHSLLN